MGPSKGNRKIGLTIVMTFLLLSGVVQYVWGELDSDIYELYDELESYIEERAREPERSQLDTVNL